MTEGIVRLPDTTVEIFTIYANWLYNNKICSKDAGHRQPENENACDQQLKKENAGDRQPENNDEPVTDREDTRLKDCYIFSDYLQDDDFKDALFDAQIYKMFDDDRQDTSWAKVIYANTRTESPHRKLVVESILKVQPVEELVQFRNEEWPRDFQDDLFTKMVTTGFDITAPRLSTREFFSGMGLCDYHHHFAKGQACYTRKI